MGPGKEKIIVIVRRPIIITEKDHDLSCYISRIQRLSFHKVIMVFHNHKCTVELDNPHSIYGFNCFEEKGHVEQRYDNFKLIDWTQED